MTTQNEQGYPVLIVGAGRGGCALLEMFLENSMVKVIAIVDPNLSAPGIKLAKEHGIPNYAYVTEALHICKNYPDCIVYNLSHDDSVAEDVSNFFGGKRVASGLEVNLFWQMVTSLKQTKDELEKSQNQLQAIIHNAMDGIITINETGCILGFNPAAEQIFGYSLQDILGKNLDILMPEPSRSEHTTYIARYIQTGQEKILGVSGREVIAVRSNGKRFPMEMSVSEMMLGGQRYFIGIVRDITERKQVEEKLAHLAHYDYLTGLPNRALFLDNLEHCLSLANRKSYRSAILFLDLDGFKKVNDTLGHDAGDMLLRDASIRMKESIRNSDAVARVGGDEFVFMLNDIGSVENAALIAQKIIGALSAPFEFKGNEFHVGGSIGISLYPDSAKDAEMLIKQADNAMYMAKKDGKNTYRTYLDLLRTTAST